MSLMKTTEIMRKCLWVVQSKTVEQGQQDSGAGAAIYYNNRWQYAIQPKEVSLFFQQRRMLLIVVKYIIEAHAGINRSIAVIMSGSY